MKRVLFALIAVASVAPTQASAQNFPDIPDNHWVYADLSSSPRVPELSKILMDAGLIHHRADLSPMSPTSWMSVRDMRIELDDQMTLLRIYLGVVPLSEDEWGGDWLAGWHKQLPVVEQIYTEWASRLRKPLDELTEMQKTIKVIKERFAARGTPVDENRFKDFSDVPDGHWAKSAIKRMRERGIIYGYPDGTFKG